MKGTRRSFLAAILTVAALATTAIGQEIEMPALPSETPDLLQGLPGLDLPPDLLKGMLPARPAPGTKATKPKPEPDRLTLLAVKYPELSPKEQDDVRRQLAKDLARELAVIKSGASLIGVYHGRNPKLLAEARRQFGQVAMLLSASLRALAGGEEGEEDPTHTHVIAAVMHRRLGKEFITAVNRSWLKSMPLPTAFE